MLEKENTCIKNKFAAAEHYQMFILLLTAIPVYIFVFFLCLVV